MTIDSDNDTFSCWKAKVARHMETFVSMGERYVRDILEMLPLVVTDDFIFDLAKQYNFDMKWLDKKKPTKRKACDPPTLPGQ